MCACVCNKRKNSHGHRFGSNKILRAFQLGKHLAASNRKLNYSGFKRRVRGFPGGSVVKNPPASAGDSGSIPDPGRSPMPWSNQAHAPQLLSLCSRAWESQRRRPMHPRICALQQGSHWNKKASSAAREHLHSPPLEKSPTQQ